jgi:CheY-like chemotaxis protein
LYYSGWFFVENFGTSFPGRPKLLTILAVGEDASLLRTRAHVLQKTGANVLCSSGASAVKFIREWEFDLIILCHSVRHQNAERITELAHRRGSKTMVMLLVPDELKRQEYVGIHVDAISFVEPGCLIRSVSDLLDRRKEEIAGRPISPHAQKKPSSNSADTEARRSRVNRFENRRAG